MGPFLDAPGVEGSVNLCSISRQISGVPPGVMRRTAEICHQYSLNPGAFLNYGHVVGPDLALAKGLVMRALDYSAAISKSKVQL